MTDMLTDLLYPVIVLITGTVAASIIFQLWQSHQKTQSYSDVDSQYRDILAMGLQYPQLRNLEHTSNYQTLANEERLRYETYAYMCMNLCETIFDAGKKLDDETWRPVTYAEIKLHHEWFANNPDKFKKKFENFINEIQEVAKF